MKKIVKFVVIAVIFVMCFMHVACMSCSDAPVEPDVSDSVPSESASEPTSDNAGTSELNDEESAYQAWKEIEVSQPAFGETGANIGAGELLERAVTIEEFIAKYPDSQYRDEAVEHYNNLVTAAITGGYVEDENNSHLYLDDNGETFSSDVVMEYDTFVNNYSDTKTAGIVREYTTLIGDADGSFTDDVKNFYKDLKNRFMELFNMDGGMNEGMNGGSAGGNMDNNASGSNGSNGSNAGGNNGSNAGGSNQGSGMGTQGNTGSGNNSGQSVQ